jgi:hypothetical protein
MMLLPLRRGSGFLANGIGKLANDIRGGGNSTGQIHIS